MGMSRTVSSVTVWRPNMLDLIYPGLGLAVFAALFLGVRAAERM
jgi:hypothetical protein